MFKAGLILEGGGMKGMYTCGVLEFFLEKKIEFSTCYGVSAGSCHLCSYLSKQPKRAVHVALDYLNDKRYCSLHSLITTGDLFGAKMCYDEIPNRLNPYDYDAGAKYPGKAYAVVTNIRTGKAEYLPMKDMRKDIVAVRASSSLPLVSRSVKIGNEFYLDGGMADSIPIRRSIEDGNRLNVVVLTKEVGYRREPASQMGLMKIKYYKYPELIKDMQNRYIQYNETLDFIEMEKKADRAFVLRPQHKSGIARIEKNQEKLKALYHEGYNDAKENYEQMIAFLNQK